ncbi:MAG TPA: ectoine/hydroxyectoine ABC transporter substrate-binding protein EhuB [Burkholderiales bacterium]|nr:ectoine/hydroxyectoine ABC transporter substrate-binding protein EhuB [Burkholderiales bacterium]
MRRRTALPALAFLLAALAGGCSEQPAATDGQTLERARAAGRIRVGYANEAPYAWLDPRTGELTGEAPAIARAVLGDMGIVEIEGVLTEFGSLIPGLKAGRFDMIAAGMYVLPARCREIAFSNPTYSVGEAFIVRAGNPHGLHGYADAARTTSATLGVVAGAVQLRYALDSGVPRERVLVFPDPPSALEGVIAGRVDAYAATALTVNDLLHRADSRAAERAQPFHDPVAKSGAVRGYGAFGFRKSDRRLVEAFNAGLAKLIGTPRHAQLVRPLGFTEQELPGTVTAEELCRGSDEPATP